MTRGLGARTINLQNPGLRAQRFDRFIELTRPPSTVQFDRALKVIDIEFPVEARKSNGSRAESVPRLEWCEICQKLPQRPGHRERRHGGFADVHVS